MDKRWISLCKVNRPDKYNAIWMQRLADSIKGALIAPEFDETKEKIFENRQLIFCEDSPTTPDSIGFWEWTERQTDSGKWLSNAIYLEDISPIEIYILDKANSVIDVVDTLKAGIHIPAYLHNDVLFVAKKDNIYEGVLCNLSYFDARPGNEVFIKLKSNIYTLPYYKLNEQDIFTWKYRKVYKYIALGDPINKAQVYDFTETIKQMILQRMTWPIFKAQGISRSDWQKFRQFLNDISDGSIVEQLSEMYSMTLQEARDCVDTFLQTVDDYMAVEDFDSGLIVQILSNHEGLQKFCTNLAYEKWCSEHQAEIAKAKGEIAAIKEATLQETALAQKQLNDIKQSIVSATDDHNALLAEICAAQSRIDNLCSEIEQYETLGDEALATVRQKIADAQKDMAGFIADISVILPQTQPQTYPDPKTRESLWQYESAPVDTYSEDEVDLSENWNDELNTINQNLVHSLAVSSDFSSMLSAFLYATHINNIPLLVAGPAGRDIAEITAISLFGSNAGHLWLGNDPSNNIAEALADYEEQIISVENMFGKGWHDELPQMFTRLNKQVIWTHPYVEDMVIEPKGLYNYMLPIFSECFIGALPAAKPWPSKRIDEFEKFVSTQKHPLKISAFKRLKLSKLLVNQLTLALSDAKAILNQPSKDKDMEVLFGLIPLCVLTGRHNILREVIETESGISAAVKAEALRYIEEE